MLGIERNYMMCTGLIKSTQSKSVSGIEEYMMWFWHKFPCVNSICVCANDALHDKRSLLQPPYKLIYPGISYVQVPMMVTHKQWHVHVCAGQPLPLDSVSGGGAGWVARRCARWHSWLAVHWASQPVGNSSSHFISWITPDSASGKLAGEQRSIGL